MKKNLDLVGATEEKEAVIPEKPWLKKQVTVDFSKVLTAGKTKLSGEQGLMTLEDVSIQALNQVAPPIGFSKDEIGELQFRIIETKKISLSGKQITWIKDAINAVCTPITVRAAFNLLDPKREFV